MVAAVPHLLGVRPADSMVLMAIHRRSGRSRLGAVARADLVPAEHVGTVVAACARRLGATAPDEVALVVVGGGDPPTGAEDGAPPRADVAADVAAVFAATRIPVASRLWVPRVATGEPWRCYPPCACAGVVPAVEDSPTAAAMAWAGQVTFGSRAELEATLAPDPGAATPRMRRLVDEALDAAALDRELAGPAAARRDLAALAAARDEVAAGRALGDTEMARLAAALRDPDVRDAALGWALPAGAEESDEAGDDVACRAAEGLWTTLVRALPAPEVAEAAALLAFSLMTRRGGALVGAALDRALRADPTHRLSVIAEGLVAGGVPPASIRDVVRASRVEARARLGAA